MIEAAIDIVEKQGGQFHVLVIIADGQVHDLNLVKFALGCMCACLKLNYLNHFD